MFPQFILNLVQLIFHHTSFLLTLYAFFLQLLSNLISLAHRNFDMIFELLIFCYLLRVLLHFQFMLILIGVSLFIGLLASLKLAGVSVQLKLDPFDFDFKIFDFLFQLWLIVLRQFLLEPV